MPTTATRSDSHRHFSKALRENGFILYIINIKAHKSRQLFKGDKYQVLNGRGSKLF